MRTLTRKISLMLLDIILVNIAIYMALLIRFDGLIPVQYLNVFVYSAVLLTVIQILSYNLFGLYKSLWKYASIDELIKIFIATTVGSIFSFLFGTVFSMLFPRTVYLIAWLITFVLIGASRLSYRILRKYRNKSADRRAVKSRVMVIGAGDAGAMVIKELKEHEELKCIPVIVIDDDNRKQKFSIHGVPIKGGRNKIKELAEKFWINEIIVALPSANKKELAEILRICKETKCKLKTLPGVYEILNDKVNIEQIRNVSIDDLLGRDEVILNTAEIAGYLEDETVLVTGGGGSIGSELCRQIAKFKPGKLLIFDICENSAFDLQNELLYMYGNKLDLEVIIGSVRDKGRLQEVFNKYRPGVVFHAAAHKHVPLMEMNPAEAIKNNVLGTLNTAQCADWCGAKRFVMISTDKAVNPTNVMGASKRVAEMIVQSMDKLSNTEYVAVRFGNVLGSNGSVLPLFKKQIARGGPVTVTHPEVKRYFMTIPESVSLVIQAGAMAKGGEIFILDMGEPVKILDLAKDLIQLSGLELDVDMKIEFIGLRPGEKLFEELLLNEEGIEATRHESIFIGKPLELSHHEVLLCVKALENSMHDNNELKECMRLIVPTYTYEHEEEKNRGKRSTFETAGIAR